MTLLELSVLRKFITKEEGRTFWKQPQKTGHLLNGLFCSLASKKPA